MGKPTIVDEWDAGAGFDAEDDSEIRVRIVKLSSGLLEMEQHCSEVVFGQWQPITFEDAHYALMDRVEHLKNNQKEARDEH